MGDFSLGSVQVEVQNMIPNVPSSLSGTNMHPLIDRKRQFVADYVNETIGSNAIGIKYQDSIILLSCSQVVKGMMMTSSNSGDVELGDFKKSRGDSFNTIARNFEEEGMNQLKLLGKNVTTYQTFYG